MRILLWLLLPALFAGAVVLSVPNRHNVLVHYYFGSSEFSVAVLVLVSIVSGAVLGVLSNLLWLLRLRYENRRLRRQLRLAEQESAELRLQNPRKVE